MMNGYFLLIKVLKTLSIDCLLTLSYLHWSAPDGVDHWKFWFPVRMHNHDRKSNQFEVNWACGHIISKWFDFRSIKIFWSNGKSGSKDKPVLLTMDIHIKHLNYKAVHFAKENGIVLLTFLPHYSHALQPLDVCVFGPFKQYLSKSHNEWLRLNPGKRITMKEVAKLRKQPFIESMTPKNSFPLSNALEFFLSIEIKYLRTNMLHWQWLTDQVCLISK